MLEELIEPDGLRRVVLDAGRGNALGEALLARIEAAFDPRTAPPGPVVLAARGNSFCTGLDLEECSALDRAAMGMLMDRFHRALEAVLCWPGPVVAAIQGHALAGGALLALCADRRLLAHGPARLGIHGVQLGLVYPQIAVEIVRGRLGRACTEQLLYGGELRSGHQALQEGLVDELVDAAELDARATEQARRPLDPRAKTALLRPLLTRLEPIDATGREAWLDVWFSPQTRARLAAARAARRQPRRGGRRR